jgi:HEAT repeat protein
MTRALLAAALAGALLAGCGYGPPPGEKASELFAGQRLDQARAALGSSKSDERRWAIVRLARACDPADAPAIAELLDPQREKTPLVRATAAGALRILGDRAMLPTLTRSLRDPDTTVRVEAARAIGYLGGPADIPALAHALRSDHDPRARVEAAYALQRVGSPDALPALAAALDDMDESVVFASHSALKELTRRDLPPYRRQWEGVAVAK